MMKISAILTACILFSIAGISHGDIAFVANVEGNWDLFSVDESGGNLIQLTATPFDEKNPSWSSDGMKIVYATSDGLLNVVDIVSRESRQIAVGERAEPKITPSFSPDGGEIVFARFRPPDEGDDTDLMIFNMETKTARRVLDQPAIQMWSTWSPDGQRVVYTNMHCSGDCGRVIQELWIVDRRGGWARQLLMTHSLCQQPTWSRDGKKIAFSSDMKGSLDIWELDLQDWKLKQLTVDQNLDESPAWSSDGKKLAFISNRSGIKEIWIKDLDSGSVKKIQPFGDRRIECRDVAW